jgi:aryl-alcohol dehydrogenase-like predicted oxidoreductase
VDRVEELAKKKNIPMAQVAVAWSMAKTVAPVIGSTTLKHLQEMIGEFSVLFCLCVF